SESYSLFLSATEQLDSVTTLGAAVRYDRLDQHDVYRSLEKDFYEHYFSIIDTTTGNTYFDGPQLWFLYNRVLSPHLLIGLDLNYGVERGLKDRYTRCETIIRNYDVSLGLKFHTQDLSVGFSYRGLSQQSKYEAVKEYKDALVKAYFGYHVIRFESPKNAVIKSGFEDGYEISGQFEKKHIILEGLNLLVSASFGEKTTLVELGRRTKPQHLGTWVREGYQIDNALVYRPANSRTHISIFYGYRQFSDWAVSGQYNSIMLENDEQSQRVGAAVYLKPTLLTEFKGGFSVEIGSRDYREYILPFQYRQDPVDWSLNGGFRSQLDADWAFIYEAEIARVMPPFYWETDQFSIQAIKVGVERRVNFRKVGLEFNYSTWQPDSQTGSISSYGLTLSLEK
ncbi:MAG: hypothetical protein KAU50_04240, partial [Candidatus Marinimicrobia bacterium]|nr:hypothetical protein [Candidatus Neomarinimicrobiota bacterium]